MFILKFLFLLGDDEFLAKHRLQHFAPGWYGTVFAVMLHSTQGCKPALYLPESFTKVSEICFSSMFKVMIMVVAPGFELHFTTTMIESGRST